MPRKYPIFTDQIMKETGLSRENVVKAFRRCRITRRGHAWRCDTFKEYKAVMDEIKSRRQGNPNLLDYGRLTKDEKK